LARLDFKLQFEEEKKTGVDYASILTVIFLGVIPVVYMVWVLYSFYDYNNVSLDLDSQLMSKNMDYEKIKKSNKMLTLNASEELPVIVDDLLRAIKSHPADATEEIFISTKSLIPVNDHRLRVFDETSGETHLLRALRSRGNNIPLEKLLNLEAINSGNVIPVSIQIDTDRNFNWILRGEVRSENYDHIKQFLDGMNSSDYFAGSVIDGITRNQKSHTLSFTSLIRKGGPTDE
jgi:hypothetical protein